MSKTILITGASSGIGKVTAKHFHEKGWNVVATMRAPEKEEDLLDSDNMLVTKLDVLDLHSINEAVSKSIEKFGKIDVLVNNAGYGAYGPLEAFPRENIIRQFNTNVIGLLDVTRALLPHFRENQTGVIVNISSIGGRMTFPFGSLYHGTKFAVEGISEALHFEMAAIGVKVKIIEPGGMKTDFGGRSFDMQNDESLKEYQPMIGKLMKGMQDVSEQLADPIIVAEKIFEAVTDDTERLRYPAGVDADEYMTNRSKLDDETFIGGIKKRFGM